MFNIQAKFEVSIASAVPKICEVSLFVYKRSGVSPRFRFNLIKKGEFTAYYYDLHPGVDAVKCRASMPACRASTIVLRSYAARLHASVV